MTLLRRQFLHWQPVLLPRRPSFAMPWRTPIRPAGAYHRPLRGGRGQRHHARLIGQWLTERLGETFVTENRPGAGSNLGAEIVINSPPDGYTLLLAAVPNAVNATLYEKFNFNFMRDIAPVAGIVQVPIAFSIILRFRPKPLRNSSPTPRPSPAASTWGRPVSAAPAIWPANCSR